MLASVSGPASGKPMPGSYEHVQRTSRRGTCKPMPGFCRHAHFTSPRRTSWPLLRVEHCKLCLLLARHRRHSLVTAAALCNPLLTPTQSLGQLELLRFCVFSKSAGANYPLLSHPHPGAHQPAQPCNELVVAMCLRAAHHYHHHHHQFLLGSNLSW